MNTVSQSLLACDNVDRSTRAGRSTIGIAAVAPLAAATEFTVIAGVTLVAAHAGATATAFDEGARWPLVVATIALLYLTLAVAKGLFGLAALRLRSPQTAVAVALWSASCAFFASAAVALGSAADVLSIPAALTFVAGAAAVAVSRHGFHALLRHGVETGRVGGLAAALVGSRTDLQRVDAAALAREGRRIVRVFATFEEPGGPGEFDGALRSRTLKRGLDVVLATAGIVALLPLLALLAVLVKLDSRGPVLFRQTRVGLSGRTFTMWKFRSMTVLEDGTEVRQASRGDRRVTRVGAFIRRTSLDELPQLVNVVAGDMSLVGPRPHALAHHRDFMLKVARYASRHAVRPGITGWAQVRGYRGETPTLDLVERRIEHDLWYVANWSLWLDLRIIARTVLAVLRPPASAY